MARRIFSLLLAFVLLGSNSATAQAQPWSLVTPSAEWIVQISAAIPQARYDHGMAYDSRRGAIVLFGGLNGTGLLNDTVEMIAGAWIKRTPAIAPSARYGHTMAYDSFRNETLLFSGCGAPADTWMWDGTNWFQQHPINSPGSQCGAVMTFDARRGVAVLFGTEASSGFAQTWEWDGTNWSLRLPAHTPPARFGAGMAYDANQGVSVLYGGNVSSPDTWEWDGMDWTLRSTSGPPPRVLPTMAYDTRAKRVVLFGGQWSSFYGDTWEWDGVTGTWSERVSANNPGARVSAMVFDEARGVSVLFGGGGGDGPVPLKDTWEWNSQLGSWVNTITPAAPPAVYGPIAYDSRRQEVVLFGGPSPQAGSVTSDTWIYGADGRWVRRQPAHSPVARLDHNLAYDSHRGVTVLFGGVQAKAAGSWVGLTDTWEWDGVDWIRRYPTNSPTVPTDFAMAYDSARQVTVLFGGRDGGQMPYGETWTWDGDNWTQRFPLHSPPPRWAAEMAFDTARGVIVLFGGTNSPNANFADTWEWDGSDWKLRSPVNSPPARSVHGLAYDSARGVTVLFGGTGPGFMNDTWEWDGTNWTQVVMDNVPSARAIGPGMEYDIARRAVVLFGGSALTDETWEYRSANIPPTVDAGGPYRVDEGGYVVVTASGNDPEGGPLTYEWDLDNDGTFETPGQRVNFSAAGLSAPSSHTITVRVTDNGGLTATDQAVVNVIYNFMGFISPVDNPQVMNIAKAGQTIPLKWRITDANGNPIINLTSVTVTAVSLPCQAGTTTDLIEEYASGGSGLRNLGDGYYQWNWKTPTTYANSCKTLKLDLGEGAGFEHTALFQFKK